MDKRAPDAISTSFPISIRASVSPVFSSGAFQASSTNTGPISSGGS
jgi:hypothetical protein